MATRSVATVFGGSGFIGRYVVKRLAQAGHVVRVAGRDTERARLLGPMGMVGQIVPLFTSLTERGTIERAVAGADMVVNLVGILAERRAGDFQRIQAEGPALIGSAAAAAGVGRIVHLSAIGADPAARSLYARSKGQGEQALHAACPIATILRPSVAFGPEDQFFNRFASLAMFSPVMPVIAGATRLQPVYVGDVADAVMAGLSRNDAAGRIYELGGPEIRSFRGWLAFILEQTRRRRWLLEVPMWLAHWQAQVLERLPGRLLTRDQLLMLMHDNVVAEGAATLRDLGIVATPADLVVPSYLARFRPGGGHRELYAV